MVELVVTKDSAKRMAERLRAYLAGGGITLKQTHAYEALAQTLGYRDWNSLAPQLTANGAAQPKASRFEVCWPWVVRAAEAGVRPNGVPHHRVEGWINEGSGDSSACLAFPTLAPEPEPLQLPIVGRPDVVQSQALSGAVILAICDLLGEYVEQRMEGLPEAGTEVSQPLRWGVVKFTLPGSIPIKLVIRTRGADTFDENQSRLTAATVDVIADFKVQAAQLLQPYRERGDPWQDLEKFGAWVPAAVRAARLIEDGWNGWPT